MEKKVGARPFAVAQLCGKEGKEDEKSHLAGMIRTCRADAYVFALG